VFVDGAAGLALAAPALEGGLVLHLRTLSHNVLSLMSPLEHRAVSSPVGWPSHTHTHVRVATRVHLGHLFSHATTRLSSNRELTFASDINFSPLHSHRFLLHQKTIADRSSRALLFYNLRN
jgi:hypothetical protein